MAATVVTAADTPATVVTLAEMPATVLMLLELPATATTSVSMAATATISVAMAAIADTSTAVSPGLGLPKASKARYLPARSALRGSVILMSVGSVTGALSPRSEVSATCWIKMVWASSSSLSVLAKKSPPVVKSVVRAMVLEPTIVILLVPAVTTKVTDPVPLALIVTL